jgi:hypothetical protein
MKKPLHMQGFFVARLGTGGLPVCVSGTAGSSAHAFLAHRPFPRRIDVKPLT